MCIVIGTKKRQVMEHIRDAGAGRVWRGWFAWQAAAECSCSSSAVYLALAELKRMGAMAEDFTYTGRQYITVEEIAAAFADPNGIGYLLTDERYAILCQRFYCDKRTLWFSIDYARRVGYLEQRNGGSYGLMFLGKAAA